MKFDEYREALTALFKDVGYEGNPFDYYVIDASDCLWCTTWKGVDSDVGEIIFYEPEDSPKYFDIQEGENFFSGKQHCLFIDRENITDECMGTAYFFYFFHQLKNKNNRNQNRIPVS